MATGTEMTNQDGGTIAAIIVAVTGGVTAIIAAVGRASRLRARVTALEAELAEERAARQALADSIAVRVTEEVGRALAAMPKPKALPARLPSGSMPSVDKLRDLIASEVERAVRQTEAEQSAQIAGLLKRVDDAMAVALRALGSG